ncbi:HIT family protein [candidate division WOR-3 bacterium]|nr:HIT family protein [candidate division WOR-3 bacterium]
MIDCIFCRILSEELPSSKIYEDDLVIAIMDIQPVNKGHVLIIPRKHCKSPIQLSDITNERIMSVAKKINKAIRETDIRAEGINYFLADGEKAGQEVFHVHLHVFPRYKNDGFGLKFSEDYRNIPSRRELDEIAEKIRTAL